MEWQMHKVDGLALTTPTKALSKEYELEAVNQLSVSDTARITQIMQTPTLQAIARHNFFTSS